MPFFLTIFLFLSVIPIDYFTLVKKVSTWEKAVYFSLMLASFSILVLHSLSVPVPSPTDAIISVLDALLHINK